MQEPFWPEGLGINRGFLHVLDCADLVCGFAALRRSCSWWMLPEDLGDRLLRSEHLAPSAEAADYFWIYGCPNGDTLLPALRWVNASAAHWREAVPFERVRGDSHAGV